MIRQIIGLRITRYLLVIVAVSAIAGCRSTSLSTASDVDLEGTKNHSSDPVCGEPLVGAWDEVYKTSLAAAPLPEALAKISAANLDVIAQEVDPLNPDESAVFNAFLSLPAPIVRRINFSGFMRVFDKDFDGAFRSIRGQGRKSPRETGKSNSFEDELYNAWSCAFVTVGSSTGREIYGEVLIGLRGPLPDTTWGTTYSAARYFFPNASPSFPTDRMEQVSMRAKYAKALFVPQDWPKWSAYDAIRKMRANRGKLSEVLSLLKERDPAKRSRDFWNYFSKNEILALEAKMNELLPFETIEFIEMSPVDFANANSSDRIPDHVKAMIRVNDDLRSPVLN